MVRAVVDTNVWISGLLNPVGFPSRILAAFADGVFTAVTSLPLLEELAEVLERLRLRGKYGLTVEDITAFVTLVQERSIVIEVTGGWSLCRDPDDDVVDVVLETAVRGHAGYVVTRDDDLKGDQDLVRLLAVRQVQVLSVHRFLDLPERD